MTEALRALQISHSPGASLFLFATREDLRGNDPRAYMWHDGTGRDIRLIKRRAG